MGMYEELTKQVPAKLTSWSAGSTDIILIADPITRERYMTCANDMTEGIVGIALHVGEYSAFRVNMTDKYIKANLGQGNYTVTYILPHDCAHPVMPPDIPYSVRCIHTYDVGGYNSLQAAGDHIECMYVEDTHDGMCAVLLYTYLKAHDTNGLIPTRNATICKGILESSLRIQLCQRLIVLLERSITPDTTVKSRAENGLEECLTKFLSSITIPNLEDYAIDASALLDFSPPLPTSIYQRVMEWLKKLFRRTTKQQDEPKTIDAYQALLDLFGTDDAGQPRVLAFAEGSFDERIDEMALLAWLGTRSVFYSFPPRWSRDELRDIIMSKMEEALRLYEGYTEQIRIDNAQTISLETADRDEVCKRLEKTYSIHKIHECYAIYRFWQYAYNHLSHFDFRNVVISADLRIRRQIRELRGHSGVPANQSYNDAFHSWHDDITKKVSEYIPTSTVAWSSDSIINFLEDCYDSGWQKYLGNMVTSGIGIHYAVNGPAAIGSGVANLLPQHNIKTTPQLLPSLTLTEDLIVMCAVVDNAHPMFGWGNNAG